MHRGTLVACLGCVLVMFAASLSRAAEIASFDAHLNMNGIADDPRNQGWLLSDASNIYDTIDNQVIANPAPGAILADNNGDWEMKDVPETSGPANDSGVQFYFREVDDVSDTDWSMSLTAAIKGPSGATLSSQSSGSNSLKGWQSNLFQYQLDGGLNAQGLQRYDVWRIELGVQDNGNDTWSLYAFDRSLQGGNPSASWGTLQHLLTATESAVKAFHEFELRYSAASGDAVLYFNGLQVMTGVYHNFGGSPKDIDGVHTEIISGMQKQVIDSPELGFPGINTVAFGSFAEDLGGHVVVRKFTFQTLESSQGLPGDYNGDNFVDAADYTVWRNHLGDLTEDSINNNGNGGGVDESDYLWWKQHYGTFLGKGGLAAVPEPSTAGLILSVLIVVIRRRKWKRMSQ